MMIVLIFYTNFLLDRPISLRVRICHFSFQLSIMELLFTDDYLILIKRVDGTIVYIMFRSYSVISSTIVIIAVLIITLLLMTHFDRPAKYSHLQKYRNRIEQDLHFFCEWGKIEK